MNIRLKEIGIISDSVITLNGLTVITGKNNSGKTTVGKALYSILDAVSDIERKFQDDKVSYIRSRLDEVRSIMDYIRLFGVIGDDDNPLFQDYPSIQQLFGREYRKAITQNNIEDFAHGLLSELQRMDFDSIKGNNRIESFFKFIKEQDNNALRKNIMEQKDSAIMVLTKMFETFKTIRPSDYIRESINQTLQVEFSNQIQPVRVEDCESLIELSDKDEIFFKLKIKDNRIVNDGNQIFFSSPIKKAFLIDDPFVIDENTYSRRLIHGRNDNEIETILNPNRINPHNEKLIISLKRPQVLTVLELAVLEDSLKPIREQIDAIIPGTFEFSSNGEYYIQNGSKLKVSNLATGSKMYSIIKILLEKGMIDSSTMLILDEPEAHLHPQWQNRFAETIAMLVARLDINILLTTHSPNFVLALDAFMRKYNIQEKTNFYQTRIREDGFVDYSCVNDNIGLIYQDFADYLSEVKMLRNQFYYGDNEA